MDPSVTAVPSSDVGAGKRNHKAQWGTRDLTFMKVLDSKDLVKVAVSEIQQGAAE